ncbi:MAG: hypothetical protein AVDCRST_MAG14-83 [uncultured Rubrobacteraceae bacterium]|uniref:Uncharacterized protein n=1 Tax=uncultured Rubrobacteraceae bacterium TaxID=349277 RepID=A0A6J4QFB9_9ACTN|nr:MAG: hypothetical protein AVDCRST_MAG14-83 [uncultured Rubrobacteraceae bacterium]
MTRLRPASRNGSICPRRDPADLPRSGEDGGLAVDSRGE